MKTIRTSIINIPQGLFENYPLRVAGNLEVPLFCMQDVCEIADYGIQFTDNPDVDTVSINGLIYLHEIPMYKILMLSNNDYSAKFFDYVVHRLSWARQMVSDEISNGPELAKALAGSLRTASRLAYLTFKKYKHDVKVEAMTVEENRELNLLMSNLHL